VKSLLKPLGVIALLVCKLAQATIVPPPPVQHDSCPQHSMQQMMSSHESTQHAPCCKYSGCDCLQAPALAGPGLQAPVFVGATDSSALAPAAQLPGPAGSFFRPPIR
jgi:hypothetical protein